MQKPFRLQWIDLLDPMGYPHFFLGLMTHFMGKNIRKKNPRWDLGINWGDIPWYTFSIHLYPIVTGWWFGTFWNIFPYIGKSWSQLTFILICFRGVGQPPTSYSSHGLISITEGPHLANWNWTLILWDWYWTSSWHQYTHCSAANGLRCHVLKSAALPKVARDEGSQRRWFSGLTLGFFQCEYGCRFRYGTGRLRTVVLQAEKDVFFLTPWSAAFFGSRGSC